MALQKELKETKILRSLVNRIFTIHSGTTIQLSYVRSSSRWNKTNKCSLRYWMMEISYSTLNIKQSESQQASGSQCCKNERAKMGLNDIA